MAKNTEQMISFIEEAKKFSDLLSSQMKLLNEMAGQIQTTYQVPSDYLKQMKELAKAQSDLAKANKANESSATNLEKVKQQELITKQRKIDLERKQLSLSEQQRKATLSQEQAEKRRIAQAERLAKQTLNQNSAYLKLNATWRAAQRTLADLLATEGASTKEIAKARKEFERLDKQVKTIDSTVRNYSKNVGNYGSALSGVNSALSTLGIGVGVAGAMSIIKDAFVVIKDFDNEMINVQKTTGLTTQELDLMRDSVIGLSEELKVVRTDKLASYMAVAGQLGVKGTENLLNFTSAMAQLEVASTISGEQGASEIARFLTLVDGGVQNVKDFGNEVVILGNNFAATESEILSNATRIAQSTSVYNLSRQQVLAYATATKAVGVEAELVGSTMGRTLAIFERAIRTEKGLTDITKALGTTQGELSERFKSDASGVLMEYIRSLNNVYNAGGSVNEQLEAIGITSIRDQAVISSLASKGFGQLEEAMNKVTDAGTAMSDEFENASQKITNKIEQVNVSWSNFILNIDNGTGAISRFSVGFLDFINEAIKGLGILNKTNEELEADFSKIAGQNAIDGIKIQTENYLKETEKRRIANGVAFTEEEKFNEKKLYQQQLLSEGFKQQSKIINDAQRRLRELDKNRSSQNYDEIIRLQKDIKNARDAYAGLSAMSRKVAAEKYVEPEKATNTGANGNNGGDKLTDSEIKALKKAEQERLALKHQVAQAELSLQIETDYKLALEDAHTSEQRLEIQLAYIYSKRALIEQQYQEEVRLAEGNTDKIRLADIKRLNDTQKNQNELEKLVIDFEDKKAEEIQKGIDERKKLDEQEKKEAEERQKRHIDRMISYLSKYTDLGQFGFSSLNNVFDKNFQELMKNGTAMERMQGIATVTGDVLKDVFNNIADIQRANYEAQMSRLSNERDFAITMAGDNAAAKEEIEKQYEEKRKDLARKQAEADKKQAIFNTTISIAQGIAAALPNLVLAGVVASLGAAQLGAIIATPIPEYWTGTDNAKEGLAWTQEKRAEVITDKHGNVKTFGHNKGATLTYMEQGDKVFKSQDAYLDSLDTSELDNILMSNNIQRTIEYNGITANEMRTIMHDSIGSITVESTTFDELGISKRRSKMAKKQSKRNIYANT